MDSLVYMKTGMAATQRMTQAPMMYRDQRVELKTKKFSRPQETEAAIRTRE